jgi:hypothetical protein
VYVEAAMTFARRVLKEQPDGDVDARLAYAFRLALARVPAEEELATLRDLYTAQLAAARDDPQVARQFVGDFTLPDGVVAEELVAWYAIAAALLNLDETITKG